jgi:nucleotide-binding universal stress UspA family protein
MCTDYICRWACAAYERDRRVTTMKVVIAYDGSDCAMAAVDDLRRSGVPRRADALVISVGETRLPTPETLLVTPSSAALLESGASRRVASTLVQARAQASHAIDEAGALALAGALRVKARFPDWEVSTGGLVGTPAPAVMQKAEDWHADLIVVGSHGRSAIGRLLLGSVSKQVATAAPCSVLVARHVIERGNAPVRIVIGVDGSSNAEVAVRAAALGEWPEGTQARVIAVDDTVRPTGTAMALVPPAAVMVSESNQEHVTKMRQMMERAAIELRAAGLQVSPELVQGSAQRILCDEAKKWDADCIFVGSRGLTSTLERFRTGSVSTALVTNAPCSVEVVRVGDRHGSSD